MLTWSSGYPKSDEIESLEFLIRKAAAATNAGSQANDSAVKIHSLLHNDLGVQLPLHISLSRTLALTAANKDRFAATLERLVLKCGIKP